MGYNLEEACKNGYCAILVNNDFSGCACPFRLDDPRYCAEGTIILSLEKTQLHGSAQGAHSLFDID